MPPGATTVTLPAVAPAGTEALISNGYLNYSRHAIKADPGRAGQIAAQNVDGRPRLAGCRLCFHKRARPTDKLNTVPQQTPPVVSWIGGPGPSPSPQQKLYSVLNSPFGVILNIVP